MNNNKFQKTAKTTVDLQIKDNLTLSRDNSADQVEFRYSRLAGSAVDSIEDGIVLKSAKITEAID